MYVSVARINIGSKIQHANNSNNNNNHNNNNNNILQLSVKELKEGTCTCYSGDLFCLFLQICRGLKNKQKRSPELHV